MENELTKSVPSPSPAMPTDCASAEVPPSHTASAAIATPAGVTATGTATLTAVAVAVRSPELSTKSSPEPASIAAARAVVVACDSATDRPAGVTATPIDGTAETAIASTEPLLLMESSPLTTSELSEALRTTPIAFAMTLVSTVSSRPSPSPLMPIASEFAVVPPSQIASAETVTPAGVTVTETASALATAVAARSPLLSMMSFPEPASIAVARAFAVAVDDATDTPAGVMATPTDGATATAVAAIPPLLMISSSPVTVVQLSEAATRVPNSSTSTLNSAR